MRTSRSARRGSRTRPGRPATEAGRIVGLALVAGMLAACGLADEVVASRDDYVVLIHEWMDANLGRVLYRTDEERECVAGAMVDAVGIAPLAEAVPPQDLGTGGDVESGRLEQALEAGLDERAMVAFYDGVSACIDLHERLVTGPSARIAEQEGYDDEVTQCVTDALRSDEDLLRDMFIASPPVPNAPAMPADLQERFEVTIAPCGALLTDSQPGVVAKNLYSGKRGREYWQ